MRVRTGEVERGRWKTEMTNLQTKRSERLPKYFVRKTLDSIRLGGNKDGSPMRKKDIFGTTTSIAGAPTADLNEKRTAVHEPIQLVSRAIQNNVTDKRVDHQVE